MHDVAAEHARYADWDAAYVLGSLSRAERTEYESHLESCDRCRAAVGELAPLPGLLGRVDETVALDLVSGAPAPVSTIAPPARRWRPNRLVGGLAAAAVLLLAVLVPTLTLGGNTATPSTTTIALHQTVPSPLTATVSLVRTSWGTQVAMTCRYAQSYSGAEAAYHLYVIDTSGRASLVSSWHAGPGDVARTTGSTNLSPSAIAAVQIRSADGSVLLSGQTAG